MLSDTPGSQNHFHSGLCFLCPYGSLLFSLDFSSWWFLLVCCSKKGAFTLFWDFWSFCDPLAFTCELLGIVYAALLQFWLLFYSELDSSIWGKGQEVVLPIGSLISGWSGFGTVQNILTFFLLNGSCCCLVLLWVFGPSCSYFGVHE